MDRVNGKQILCNIPGQCGTFFCHNKREKLEEGLHKHVGIFGHGRCFHQFADLTMHWFLFQGRELVPNISFEMLKTIHEIEFEIGFDTNCRVAETM